MTSGSAGKSNKHNGKPNRKSDTAKDTVKDQVKESPMNPTKMPINTPRTARILALLVLFTLAIVAATPSWATLTATADRTVISSNETLQLLVRLDSQALLGEPEFSVLENDFEILSTSRQQQYSRVNGE